jgi:hypothetical protein
MKPAGGYLTFRREEREERACGETRAESGERDYARRWLSDAAGQIPLAPELLLLLRWEVLRADHICRNGATAHTSTA